MFLNSPQPLVQVPAKSNAQDDSKLPRGECSFIVPDTEGNGARQRCSCRSFYSDAVVRSRCGCGHQAWHHEAEPVAVASMDKFTQMLERMELLKQEVQRFETVEQQLRQELHAERMAREELTKTHRAVEGRLYDNMRMLKMAMDDRVEAVVDKTTEFSNQIKSMEERLTILDDVSMDLENRIDCMASGSSRTTTPAMSTPRAHRSSPLAPVPQLPLLMQTQHSLGQLPIRTDKKYPPSWTVRVIFVPQKSQKFAFDPDSAAYKRCSSRRMHQNLEFPGQDSSCFSSCIDSAFKFVLRGRSWMPLVGHRPVDEPFGRMALNRLSNELVHRAIWDYPFLEDHCIAHDKMQGDVLYITLQHEDLTWNEIRFLPAVTSADESCWNSDEELDGASEYKSLDAEIMYEYQDPPPTYSSRTQSQADRALSKLDVLADSAAMLAPMERVPTHASEPSTRLSPMHRVPTEASARSSNPRYSSEHSSLRSFESEMTDDEHRDKKPKLRSRPSMPSMHGGHAQQPMYISGRSKRKMPVREKGIKEPLHFNATNLAKWPPNILQRHSKGKEAAQNP